MKSKLEYLTKVSLDRKLKTKWFLIANIVLALIIVAVTNIDSIIQLFGGDFDNATKVYVIDETGSYDLLKNQIETITTSIYGKENVSFEVSKYDKTEEQVKKEIEKDSNGEQAKAEDFHNLFSSLTFDKAIQQYMTATKLLLATADEGSLEKLETALKINKKVGARLESIVNIRKTENANNEETLSDLIDSLFSEN